MWSELNHPSLSIRSTVSNRQRLGREHTILQRVILTLTFIKSVTVSIAVSKIDVVLHQAWSESQRIVLL